VDDPGTSESHHPGSRTVEAKFGQDHDIDKFLASNKKYVVVDIDGIIATWPETYIEFVNKKKNTNFEYYSELSKSVDKNELYNLKEEYRLSGIKRKMGVVENAKELLKVGAIPDDSIISSLRNNVKAIVPTRAHLDHVGALTFLSNKYNAPILCTPFTNEVIKSISKDEKMKLKNPVKIVNANSIYHVSKNVEIELQKNIITAQNKIKLALQEHKHSLIQYELLSETYKMEQVRYENDALSLTDLLDTIAKKELSYAQMINAKYSYQKANYYLDYLLEKGDIK